MQFGMSSGDLRRSDLMVTKRAKAQKVKASHEEVMERKWARPGGGTAKWTLTQVWYSCPASTRIGIAISKFNKQTNLQEHHDATSHAVQPLVYFQLTQGRKRKKRKYMKR